MTDAIKKILATPKSVFIPVSVLCTTFLFMAGGMFTVAKSVWALSESISEFKYSIDKRFDCMERQIETMNYNFSQHKAAEWDRIDMERWTYLLEKENRHIPLNMPDISVVKSEVRK